MPCAAAQAAADAAMMNATLTAALDSVQLSAEERAARLHRLHFVAVASFTALNESGGALVTAMLKAWPSYWNAVEAVAAAGALPTLGCMPSAILNVQDKHVSGSTCDRHLGTISNRLRRQARNQPVGPVCARTRCAGRCSTQLPQDGGRQGSAHIRVTPFSLLHAAGPSGRAPETPIVASRLDASSRWLPGWTANQTGLLLALLPTANACATTASMDAHAKAALANVNGHIAMVPGGPLPGNCSYADIVACGPACETGTQLPLNVLICTMWFLLCCHAVCANSGLAFAELPSTEKG